MSAFTPYRCRICKEQEVSLHELYTYGKVCSLCRQGPSPGDLELALASIQVSAHRVHQTNQTQHQTAPDQPRRTDD